MTFNKKYLLASSFLILLFQGIQASGLEWQFYKKKDDIDLFGRSVPGTKIKEFKGVTVIDAKIETIVMILKDLSSYPRWMYGCKEVKIIREMDEDNWLVYYVQKTPPFVKNRDAVLRVSTIMDWDEFSFTVYMYAIKDSPVPPGKKNIRMNLLSGRWVIQDLSREKVRVTFRIMADPAGSLPALLANAKIKKMPYHTLKDLKKIATEKKYIESGRFSDVHETINNYFKDKNSMK